jgi:hypothetical protein
LSRHSQAVRTEVPGIAQAFADLRRGHGVRLDRRLEPVHPELVLHPADRAGHRLDVGDVRHPLVVVEPALELVVQRVERVLADPGHRRPRLGQRPGELPLAGGEERLDEDDVHAWNGNRREPPRQATP